MAPARCLCVLRRVQCLGDRVSVVDGRYRAMLLLLMFTRYEDDFVLPVSDWISSAYYTLHHLGLISSSVYGDVTDCLLFVIYYAVDSLQ